MGVPALLQLVLGVLVIDDRRYLSRKFWLAAAAFLAGLVFFALERMVAAEWTAYTLSVLALYLAGNVGDTWVEKLVTWFMSRKTE
jgi:hypothetical protein